MKPSYIHTNKNRLFSLLVLLGAYILLSSTCCGRKTVCNPYTTKEYNIWSQHQIGDSLFYYEADSIVGTSVVQNVTIEERTLDTNSDEYWQVKTITFQKTSRDSLRLPCSMSVTYNNDSAFVSLEGLNKVHIETVSSMEINGSLYADVRILSEQYKGQILKYLITLEDGLLQIEYGDDKTLNIRRSPLTIPTQLEEDLR